jgi:hypothetical protein
LLGLWDNLSRRHTVWMKAIGLADIVPRAHIQPADFFILCVQTNVKSTMRHSLLKAKCGAMEISRDFFFFLYNAGEHHENVQLMFRYGMVQR